MPTFLGQPFSSYFKNILGINQSSNTGVDATTRTVHDGAGNSTAISLSDDVLVVQPIVDNGTAFAVRDQGGDPIFAVDTANSVVKLNASRVEATAQSAIFNVNSGNTAAFAANTHYPIAFGSTHIASDADVDFGTGTDPGDSFTTADTDTQYASQIVPMIWIVPYTITITSITHIEGADTATGDTTRMHLKSFDFTSGSTSCLANGTLLAHSNDITNAGNEQVYSGSWTVDSADVTAGKAILAFFRSDSVNSDYSITVTVKYYIK